MLDFFDFRPREKCNRILFLGRIEKEKGILIAIEAFRKLQGDYPNLELVVVGAGSVLSEMKIHCAQIGIKNVIFKGRLDGGALVDELSGADIYLLPTYHGEGMPTSILEAMAFGLVVITRPVGGLNDFFENGKMGLLVESKMSGDFERAIRRILEADADEISTISKYNMEYAAQKFYASKVAKRLLQIFSELRQ
jgi:glycosyltransferase involved in cell wall biosynthesis